MDGTEDTETRADEAQGAGEARRPNLAERLMNPPAETKNPAALPAAAQREVAPGTGPDTPPGSGERSPQPAKSELGKAASSSSLANAAAREAMNEARRFIRIRYFSFLGLLVLLLLTLIASIATLAMFLLDGGSWEEQAASGAVAASVLLLLIVMMYRPASTFSTASVELSQLEALEVHLEKSYALWGAFHEERSRSGEMSANEIAIAVASMTAATREMVALQAQYLQPRKGAGSTAQPPKPPFPSPTSPDPRRY